MRLMDSEQTKKKLAQLAALQETTQVMADALELDEVLDLIIQNVRHQADIGLFMEQHQEAHLPHCGYAGCK